MLFPENICISAEYFESMEESSSSTQQGWVGARVRPTEGLGPRPPHLQPTIYMQALSYLRGPRDIASAADFLEVCGCCNNVKTFFEGKYRFLWEPPIWRWECHNCHENINNELQKLGETHGSPVLDLDVSFAKWQNTCQNCGNWMKIEERHPNSQLCRWCWQVCIRNLEDGEENWMENDQVSSVGSYETWFSDPEEPMLTDPEGTETESIGEEPQQESAYVREQRAIDEIFRNIRLAHRLAEREIDWYEDLNTLDEEDLESKYGPPPAYTE